jgi:hypothetical protein
MLFVVVFVEEKEKGEECVGEIERKWVIKICGLVLHVYK